MEFFELCPSYSGRSSLLNQKTKTSMNNELKLKDDYKSPKKKPTLDEFASSMLEKYLDSKAEEIEGSSSDEAEVEESGEAAEYNGFIDGMAEEGEEDTPSEDSNQTIDEGESVGFSSEEEINADDDYQNDSFICDDDDEPELLLSGDEYDLESKVKQNKNKKSRIIDPSTLGDEDIIEVPEKKKVETKNPTKKRSRIITVSDSSEENYINSSVQNDVEQVNKDQSLAGSIILTEDSNCEETSKSRIMRESKSNEPIMIEESKIENTSEAISVEESKTVESSDQLFIDQSCTKDVNHQSIIIDDSNNNNNASNDHNTSLSNLNTSLQKRRRKSSLTIQENILIDGKKDPSITKRINTLVESFCSTVKKRGIAHNLSLEYEDVDGTNQENCKTDTVHILSDIKICPNKPSASQEKHPDFTDSSKNPEERNEKLSTSLEDSVDLRGGIVTKQFRKRLSKSLDDLNEDILKSKRRKKHENKKSKQKTDSEEKLSKATTSRSKKQDNSDTEPTELRNAISSFSIINQLITDVKNRPRRVMKPTKTDIESESSWPTTKVSNLKPSTSHVTKHEKMKLPPNLHPKDFKNQMLFSDSRVKRIDIKTLLRKKGAYY